MGITPEEDQLGILEKIFQTASTAKILDFFIDHKDLDYSLGEIAKKTGLSVQTVIREIPHLENLTLIISERKVGKSSMYRLNSKFKPLILLEEFTLEMSQIPSIIEFQKPSKIQSVIESALIQENR